MSRVSIADVSRLSHEELRHLVAELNTRPIIPGTTAARLRAAAIRETNIRAWERDEKRSGT